jgi:hypothetical protein
MHKWCLVTNTATIWTFQNIDMNLSPARDTCSFAKLLRSIRFPSVSYSEVSNIICHLMQCRMYITRYGGMRAKKASFRFPCALPQGNISLKTLISQLIIIIIIVIYLLSHKYIFSGMCLLRFSEVHTSYTYLKSTLLTTHYPSCNLIMWLQVQKSRHVSRFMRFSCLVLGFIF